MDFTLSGPRTAVRPVTGGRLAVRAVAAAIVYEFRMQIRRRAVWLVMGLLGAYMLRLLTINQLRVGDTAQYQTAAWAWLLQVFMPIAVGVLLADRLVRDRRLKVDGITETAPAPLAARLAGKYVGATAATLVPMLVTYALGLVWLVSQGVDASVVAANAIPAFVFIDLPGLLFIAAFSVCTPLIMPIPVYQFLYVGYWFWGNLMPPEVMPTLRDTWLAPIGWMTARGVYHLYEDTTPGPMPTTADAVASIAILLAGAIAALVAGYVVARVRAARA